MRFEYLLLMAACLVVTLPLEFWLRARVYRRPLRLALALAPALVVFYIWDAIAIARGHWSYSPSHTTGWLLPLAVPIEELVFFLAIPICGLLTYEAVGTVMRRAAARRHAATQKGTVPFSVAEAEQASSSTKLSVTDQKGTVPFRAAPRSSQEVSGDA